MERDKLEMKNGYIVCPICRHRTPQHVGPETEASNLEVWCHRCKQVQIVNIRDSQCFLVRPC